ncbi:SKIP/SNW domain-containing protein [Aspergillus saccharolyticus JOP 1030-1]|uniref:Pre-mRNA-processing protein 45 n=1 Tax=Aspergillus saccharolyticus JOP 1030-1 TaxID=1450539 RepID=A0A318ZE20_9EURO|nr:transcriptional regulator Cwf13/SkiP [Aspergillus saccharolyticus JOP 1030-1]PYH45771.1 transcriptional regulator Cwf13/SkiP [Aspergillus saccharolyticus JOP 1030-1]
MASIAEGLFKALPKPKYTGEEEELPQHAQPRGPRVVGPGQLDETQIVLRRTGPPPYQNRAGWRPRAPEDFGDGGAFPEILVAQYPLDMGRKGTASTSNALAVQVDAEGKVKYDAIARRGHSDNRIVHASFKDLIPLRQRVDMGEVSLDRPSEEEVQAQMEKTKTALASLVEGAVSAQKPKNVRGGRRAEPTFVRYTPANNQMGDTSRKNDRIMKIVERQQDPMEPPKFKHKKIPRGPPSPPPPIMHSPPRKLTAEDQEAWKIPPPVSNWKNPKGYTVPLDKRLAADGRGLQDVTINDKFAQFAEALFTADRHAREEVRLRAQMQQKLAEKEKAQKEEHLRALAQKAREERAAASSSGGRRRDYSRSPPSRSVSRSPSRYSDRSGTPSEDERAAREREQLRRERRQEAERQLRQSRMGTERRIQMMAREQDRDISEKVALGLAKPTQSSEAMYDSRLFNQTSGMSSGFNEDNPYDKPLFAAQDAINSIYRPRAQVDDGDDDGEGAGEEMSKIQKSSRFEVLGRAKEGFKGAELAEARDGPVQFEKDTTDPFGIDSMIADVTGGGGSSGQKRYGLEEVDRSERGSKRPRVDDDDE